MMEAAGGRHTTAPATPRPELPEEGGPSHLRAVALAAFVTFLWSTSWVFIKVGLDDLELPPLSFAGLRYGLAALVLLPLAWPAVRAAGPWRHGRPWLFRAIVLGVVLYAVAQGAQFVALERLPAATVGLILAATPVAVALFGAHDRNEGATLVQGVGIAVLVVGAALYFGVTPLAATAMPALLAAVVGMLATALGARLGRVLARDAIAALGGTVGMTAISMGIGAAVLFAGGIVADGVPSLTLDGWLVAGWLAIVNTAFAFTVWNHTMRRLTAVESSVLNDLMLVQIAVLAWVFLDEALDASRIAGLALALGGVLLVQLSPLFSRVRARAAGRGG